MSATGTSHESKHGFAHRTKEAVTPTTVADVMVATLKASGVRRVYGLPGDSINGFTDALRRDGEMAWEHVRHEEAAAFAAAGEAAMTGQLAVCAASCGPGNLHLINGLFDANRTRVPVLAIAAHIPREEIGGSYFQETHPSELFRECSVYAELVSVPEQLPPVLEIAMRACDRTREAWPWWSCPERSSCTTSAHDVRPAAILPAPAVIRPSDDALASTAQALNAAERVTILAGAGCRGAHHELIALAGALKAPVVHTLRGKEFVEYDNPYDVGMTGLLGFASGYRAMEHCDALLMLGTDFPYRPFYPEQARVDPGRRPRRAHRPPDRGGHRARGYRQGHYRRAAAPVDQRTGRDAPGADAVALPSHSRTARCARGNALQSTARSIRRSRPSPLTGPLPTMRFSWPTSGRPLCGRRDICA